MRNFVTIKELCAEQELTAANQRQYSHAQEIGAGPINGRKRRKGLWLDDVAERCHARWLAARASTARGRDKAEARLASVNGKARSHTFEASALLRVAAECEQRLDAAGVPKCKRQGARATYRPAGPWAGSYKWRAISTSATIRRGATGWGLVSCERIDLWPKSPEKLEILLTAAQARAVRAKAMVGFVECFEKHGIDHLSASSINLWANAPDVEAAQ